MTVTTTTAALLAWAFIISLFLNWYWSGKTAQLRDACDLQKRINEKNTKHEARHSATLIAAILDHAQLTRLPPLNSKKWATLQDLYASYEFEPYNIPAQVTTDHDNRPAVYWKVTNVNELSAYELARLWLAGVL